MASSTLLKLLARMGDVTFKEEYIAREKGQDVYGTWLPDLIVVNPVPHVVDTVLHELAHQVFPDKSERAISSLVTRIMRQLTDDELQTIYHEYQLKLEK